MTVMVALYAEARAKKRGEPVVKLGMFHALAGTKRLHRMLSGGSSAADIIAAWQPEVARFKAQRKPYLLYPG
jgi:hypothetical protein